MTKSGGGINGQIEFPFSPYMVAMLNIETGIGLEAAIEVFSSEGSRTKSIDVDIQLLCENIN